MTEQGFVFVFILNSLCLEDEKKIKAKLITVDVDYGDISMTIESKAKKVKDFRAGRSYEFFDELESLRRMAKDTINVTVNYDEQPLATGTMDWDQELIDKLEGDAIKTFTNHSQLGDIILESSKGDIMGRLTVIIKLQCKCVEQDNEQVCQPYLPFVDAKGTLGVYHNYKDKLGQNDVLFVIGDTNECNRNVLTHCSEKECPSHLDTSRYNKVKGKLVTSTDVLTPCCNFECCVLNDKEKVDDTIMELCENKKDTENLCQANLHVADCPHSRKFPRVCSNNSICITYKEMIEDMKEKKKFCEGACFPKSESDIEEPEKKATLLKKILDEFAEITPDSVCPNTRCLKRCKCKNGKTCAQCRINQVVKDLTQEMKLNKCMHAKKKPLTSKCTQPSVDEIIEEYVKDHDDLKEQPPFLSSTLQALKVKYKLTPKQLEGFKRTKSGGCKKDCSPVAKYCRNEMKLSTDLKRPPKIDTEDADKTECMLAEEKVKLIHENRIKRKQKKVNRLYRKYKKIIAAYPRTFAPHNCNQIKDSNGVPKHMGWMWKNNKNVGYPWKPGYIAKPIKEIMKYFLNDYPTDTLLCTRRNKKPKCPTQCEVLEQKPLLKIKKQDGEYIVTLRPLKSAKEVQLCPNPYLNIKPLELKILKSPVLIYTRQLKKDLKKKYGECSCLMPVSSCFCRSFDVKNKLIADVEKECGKKAMPVECIKNKLCLDETTESDSELDIEFTPPVGLIKPALLPKNDICCRCTQYDEDDYDPLPYLKNKINCLKFYAEKYPGGMGGKAYRPGYNGVTETVYGYKCGTECQIPREPFVRCDQRKKKCKKAPKEKKPPPPPPPPKKKASTKEPPVPDKSDKQRREEKLKELLSHPPDILCDVDRKGRARPCGPCYPCAPCGPCRPCGPCGPCGGPCYGPCGPCGPCGYNYCNYC